MLPSIDKAALRAAMHTLNGDAVHGRRMVLWLLSLECDLTTPGFSPWCREGCSLSEEGTVWFSL